MTARIFGPRRTIVGPGFSPTSISAVTGWLRLAERTDTGTLTIPDVLGGPSAVQATAGEKPTFGTANGLPIATFDGAGDNLEQALASASNNNSPRRGIAFWFNPSSVAGFHCFFNIGTVAGSSAGSMLCRQSGATLLLDVNIDASNIRRAGSGSNLTISTWQFITFEYDGDQTDEGDECIITLNNTKLGPLNFTDASGTPGDMPDTLVQPTGSMAYGVSNTGSNAQPLAGSIGPNIFWLGGAGGISGGGLLTSAQRLALANFDNPTGTPL